MSRRIEDARQRRQFLTGAGAALLAALLRAPAARAADEAAHRAMTPDAPTTLALCGDVMSGRGLDQILPHPGNPRLYESYVRDARDYVDLARRHGAAIPERVAFDYPWGDALPALRAESVQARIVNLETSITRSARPWPKGINYRMEPGNTPLLAAARIDCCALANNHVLDWGQDGLAETLATLKAAGIATAGAGRDLAAAQAPALLPLADARRLLVFAAATGDCGVPPEWAASRTQAGIWRLPALSPAVVDAVAGVIAAQRRPGDVVVLSLHWGGNWDATIPAEQRAFAQGLIDHGAVDVIHGHSSHHVKGIEVHRGRLILYGCGDFLDDYEGIAGHEALRGDLGFAYFPTLAAEGRLLALELLPTRIRGLRIEHPSPPDRAWLRATIDAAGAALGTRLRDAADGRFALDWRAA